MYVGENVRLPLCDNGIRVPWDGHEGPTCAFVRDACWHTVVNSSTYIFTYQYLCLNVIDDTSFLV